MRPINPVRPGIVPLALSMMVWPCTASDIEGELIVFEEPDSAGHAVNNHGTVCGYMTEGNVSRAMRWVDGGHGGLVFPDSSEFASSDALSINDAGVVTGLLYDHLNEMVGPVVSDDGHITMLEAVDGQEVLCWGIDINAHGDVLGRKTLPSQAFLYAGDQGYAATQSPWGFGPYDMNDHGQVVGVTIDPITAATWDGTTITELGPFLDEIETREYGFPRFYRLTMAKAINNRGHIAGDGESFCCRGDGFFWTPDTGYIPRRNYYGTRGRSWERTMAMNESGMVVGTTGLSVGPALWHDGWMIDLNQVVPADSPWRGKLRSANDISDTGYITGRVYDRDADISYTYRLKLPDILPCRGDCSPVSPEGYYGDGVINIDDLLEMINHFGPIGIESGPWNIAPVADHGYTFGDDAVDIDDLLELISRFGPCPSWRAD